MKQINHFLLSEPQWRPAKTWFRHTMPAPVKFWLSGAGSLTQKIQQYLLGNFNVEVLGEALDKPFSQDQALLKQGYGRQAFVREVVLQVAQQPCVFARTTMPLSSLQGLQKISKLGARPLGEVIFSYPNLKREQLDFAKIKRSQLSLQAQQLTADSDTIWARRNTYVIQRNRLIVCEFFISKMFEGF